jgi:hypothetical protein
MTKTKLAIPVYKLAFLQEYLYEIFTLKKTCENNSKHTKWYLKENISEKNIEKLFEFFKDNELNCDSGILKKLDLREIFASNINFHS